MPGRDDLPPAGPGQRIGLLGGSFDPPHEGHLHISKQALVRFGLDRVWWLVSPGNPLKPDSPAAFERRMAACRALVAGNRRIVVSDLERRLGTRHTVRTLERLIRLYPGVRFVWLMGADNLEGFHRWRGWQRIMGMVPVGVLGRPGHVVRAGLSPAARAFGDARLPARRAHCLPLAAPPAWCLLPGPTVDLSSTGLRERGVWRR